MPFKEENAKSIEISFIAIEDVIATPARQSFELLNK